MSTASETKASAPEKKAEPPKTVRCRYVGPAHVLVDDKTQKIWDRRDGGVNDHEVPLAEAERLFNLPFDQFEVIE